jgi:hypothetical protein
MTNTMTEKYFDVKKWVKKYFELSSSDKYLDNTNNSLEFIWVWSIFEHKYLKYGRDNKSYNEQLVDLSVKFPSDRIDIDTIYEFLHIRYFKEGKTTTFLENLNLNTKWQKLIEETLKKKDSTKVEKLKFIFIIIYKFRCNLFHGKKDPLLWNNFDEVFYHINTFLANFLEVKWKP